MKTMLAVLASVGIAAGGTYVYVSNQKDAQARKDRTEAEAKWEAEKGQLEKDLKSAKGRSPRIETVNNTVEVPVETKASARQILDKLVGLKAASDSTRNQSIRKIVHQLESLAELGNDSVPAIKAFLALNQDVEYERDRTQDTQTGADGQPSPPGGNGGPGGGPGGGRGGFGGGQSPWSNNMPRTDFLYPPSLRLGLEAVLREIGTPEAEQVLAEVLQTTGRGVEVATVAKFLQEMAPNKYRDMAIQAAKELLSNPVTVDNPTRLDEQSKSYLYAVLREFNDTSFAPTAQTLLVGTDGKIDRSALAYLNSALKEGAVSSLYQAYMDPRVTNQWDKTSILTTALNYAGTNPQANEMFRSVVNGDQNGFAKYLAVASLAGGDFGPVRRDQPSDPNVIQARIKLLDTVDTTDERFSQIVTRTKENLQNILDGKPVDNSFGGRIRGGGPGGDTGGRRNRPGQ